MSEHRSLPPDYRHTRATECARLRAVTFCRRLVAQPRTPQCNPQAVQPFKSGLPMLGVEGNTPRLSLGDQKGVFSSEREYPLCLAAAQSAATPPFPVRGNQKGYPLRKENIPFAWQWHSAPHDQCSATRCAPSPFEGTKKEPSNGRLSFLLD